MSINRVNISGNLTRDPELKTTAGGTAVLNFGVAVNDRVRDQVTGEWGDRANFVDCVVFGARAEPLSRFLFKGTKVAIEGKLRWRQWETDGQKRSKLEVVVDEVEFLSPRQGGGGSSYGADGQAPRYAAPAPAAAPQVGGGYGAQAAPAQGYAPAAPAPAAPAPAAPAAPAPAPAAYGAGSTAPANVPPSADVYDEDIPF